MTHKVVIIGAVAAGMSAATRLRRLDESAHIVVLEAGEHVSFANCGLPYYAGGVIEERDALLLQTPDSLHARFNLDVRTGSRAQAIDTAARTVTVTSAERGTYVESYDSLILAPGAQPIVPPIPGAERALTLRDVSDVDRIVESMSAASTAVVIGAGFIGLEIAENLAHRGIAVTVIDVADQVLSALDPEMAVRIEQRLSDNGVTVHTGTQATAITADAVLTQGPHGSTEVAADLVVAAVGVRPDTHLAVDAGLALAANGGIAVDDAMRTSNPHVYAVGDAAAKADAFSDEPTLIPLANLANRHGRRAADAIAGRSPQPVPSIGTAVVGVFGLTAAVTGRTERRLRAEGRPYRPLHTHPLDHAGYYPGASALAVKLLVDPDTDAILGAQAVGEAGADKRIDVIATAIRGGLRAQDLADLELAYAPAYGSAKDPVNMLGYVAENAAAGTSPMVQWHEITATDFVLDVRTPAEHADGYVDAGGETALIPVDDLRERHGELPRDRRIVVHCKVGQRGHTATMLLRSLGFEAVNLDGGYLTWKDGRASTARA